MSSLIVKTCLDCKEEKDNIQFAKDPKHTNGTKNICKLCAAARIRKYNAVYYEKARKRAKRYRENNPEKVALAKKKWYLSERSKEYQKEYSQKPETRYRFRLNQWKRKYGIEPKTAIKLLESQDTRCAICGQYLEKPFLDHCHATFKIRGFLCINCNMGLGAFQDNTLFLTKAINYLQAHIPSGQVVT